MELTYLNHSSFILKTKVNGEIIKVLFSPFSDAGGVKFKKTEANIILLSSLDSNSTNFKNIAALENFDINDESFESQKDKPYVIKTSGEFEVKGVHIKGISSENNIIYVVQSEGFHICHLGNLSHSLTEDQIEQIGEVDVLLVPTGGITTLDPDAANEVVNQVEPGFVIPMNYKSEKYSLEDFLKASGSNNGEAKDSLIVQKQSGEEVEVVVLRPKYE